MVAGLYSSIYLEIMKKQLTRAATLLLLSHITYAQGPAADYADDAFRFSDFTQSGTARFRGLGGNHSALGGDASNLFGNPAGLGFYNRSELSFSPSLNLANNQSTFLGAQTTGNQGKVSVGQFGAILAGRNDNGTRRWRRTAFGITYSQSVNFHDYIDARGRNLNPNSSIAQTYINAANDEEYSETELDNDYDPSTNQVSFREAAAYRLFLINPTDIPAQNYSGPPYTRFDANTPKEQRATISRSGAHSQWTLAYAGNLDDKLYIGASVALTRLRYASEFIFTETPIGGRTFANYGQTNRFDVSGSGFNATLGLIYRLSSQLQIGATIVSPSVGSVRETFNQRLSAVANDPALQLRTNSIDVVTPFDNFEYTLQTPLRASGGLTYFIGGGKIGFVTATAEYVGYSGMRVRTSYFDTQLDNTDFRNDVQGAVQDTYQNVLNVRGGAEFRLGLFRLRGGVAYLPSAYKLDLDRVARADRDKILISGGLGVRNERFFADLSGSYLTTKSGFSPYQLPSDVDTPTVLTSNRNANATLSIGVFF